MARKTAKTPKNPETLPSVSAAPAAPTRRKGPMKYCGYFLLGSPPSQIEVLIYQTNKSEIRFLSRHRQWMKNFPNWRSAKDEIPGHAALHLERGKLQE